MTVVELSPGRTVRFNDDRTVVADPDVGFDVESFLMLPDFQRQDYLPDAPHVQAIKFAAAFSAKIIEHVPPPAAPSSPPGTVY